MELLAEARRLGIDVEYVDASGRQRRVPDTAIARIAEALRATTADRAAHPLPPAFARKAYQGPPGRWWLLAVQLYAVRSQRNWGIGDFADLRALIELAAGVGAAGVGINPLHALFDETPAQPSPYSPNSRLFLNPLYIAVDEIPEVADRPAADRGEVVREERLMVQHVADPQHLLDPPQRLGLIAALVGQQGGHAEQVDNRPLPRQVVGDHILPERCAEQKTLLQDETDLTS